MSMKNPEEAKAFGAKLRAARVRRELTILQVEETAGVSAKNIEALEEGKVETPEPHDLYYLAQCYGLNYRQLMIECGNLIPKPKA